MKRREFLNFSIAGLAANRFPRAAESPIPPAVLSRIGITTVCFRERFTPGGKKTNLLEAPKFIADNLGLHNVEVWNEQFTETTDAYCRKLKSAAAEVGSKLINIQLDGPYNLADPDNGKRAQSVTFVKEWMDRAAAIGAPTLRANPGDGPEFDVNRIADSYRQLTDHGKKIKVKILVENHIGFSKDIDKVVAIVKMVNDPYCRALADWGNTPSTSSTEKVASLRKMFPYLELVSAKELDFDENNRHVSYDIVPIIKATEASGFRGIYSIEFYTEKAPPRDPVVAARLMMQTLAANIKGKQG